MAEKMDIEVRVRQGNKDLNISFREKGGEPQRIGASLHVDVAHMAHIGPLTKEEAEGLLSDLAEAIGRLE